jgi:hypothetical protein
MSAVCYAAAASVTRAVTRKTRVVTRFTRVTGLRAYTHARPRTHVEQTPVTAVTRVTTRVSRVTPA